MNLSLITHPEYDLHFVDWLKWRLAYTGGRRFLVTYLQRFSLREQQTDFDERLAISYVPAFAKQAVNEVRDSIYNRMVDISRSNGSQSYMDAVAGLKGGVDLFGSSMNYFMGCRILEELLVMQKVGIYVDMPAKIGANRLEQGKVRPYLYMFAIEDIRAWTIDHGENVNEFSSILLEERIKVTDPETGFPIGEESRYRRMWKDPESGKVLASFHKNDEANTMTDQFGQEISEPLMLEINRIPFVILDINDSLMTDIADYQIALMNLASSDMSAAFRNNFAFYTEQYDPRAEAGQKGPDGQAKIKEVITGTQKGRRYPVGADRPGFINPAPDPLKVSMEKQEQLKFEIRQLLKLALTNLRPSAAIGAESKRQDHTGLENGLGYIGLTLENAERKVAEYWDMYERLDKTATINYPEDYKLHGETQRQEESAYLEGLQNKIASPSFQKAAAKRIARIALGSKVSREIIEKIENEIDKAPAFSANPDTVLTSVENGLLTAETGGKILGYPEGEARRAEDEHTRRLSRIAISQAKGGGAARGTPDIDPNPGTSAAEEKKQSTDKTGTADLVSKVRGDAD